MIYFDSVLQLYCAWPCISNFWKWLCMVQFAVSQLHAHLWHVLCYYHIEVNLCSSQIIGCLIYRHLQKFAAFIQMWKTVLWPCNLNSAPFILAGIIATGTKVFCFLFSSLYLEKWIGWIAVRSVTHHFIDYVLNCQHFVTTHRFSPLQSALNFVFQVFQWYTDWYCNCPEVHLLCFWLSCSVFSKFRAFSKELYNLSKQDNWNPVLCVFRENS